VFSGQFGKFNNSENQTLDVSIDFDDIKEVFNKEWRKSNSTKI